MNKKLLALTFASLSCVTTMLFAQSPVDLRQAAKKAIDVTVRFDTAILGRSAAANPEPSREGAPTSIERILLTQRAIMQSNGAWVELDFNSNQDQYSVLCGFRVSPKVLILAYPGSTAVSRKNTDGDPTDEELASANNEIVVVRSDGAKETCKILAVDHAIGLVAVHSLDEKAESLPVSNRSLEPGEWAIVSSVDKVQGPGHERAPIAMPVMIGAEARANHATFGLTHQVTLPATARIPGSPVIDAQGELAGVMLMDDSEGFILPVKSIQRLIQVAQSDAPQDLWAGFLGLVFESNELSNRSGVAISSTVPDSPAARSDLQAGDRIKSVNGVPCHRASDVVANVAMLRSGDSVTLVFDRGGTEKTIEMQLEPNRNRSIEFGSAKSNSNANWVDLNGVLNESMVKKVEEAIEKVMPPRSGAVPLWDRIEKAIPKAERRMKPVEKDGDTVRPPATDASENRETESRVLNRVRQLESLLKELKEDIDSTEVKK